MVRVVVRCFGYVWCGPYHAIPYQVLNGERLVRDIHTIYAGKVLFMLSNTSSTMVSNHYWFSQQKLYLVHFNETVRRMHRRIGRGAEGWCAPQPRHTPVLQHCAFQPANTSM